MNKPTNDSKKPKNVQEVIQQIINQSADEDYIYRGENDGSHEKVSSSLYRDYPAIDPEYFDIEVVQKEILDNAKNFTHEKDEFEILTTLQHHGGKTNLIDFTTDYFIALFFACDGKYDKDGRVILQKREPISDQIKKPKKPKNRVTAQKSVFVQPKKGFIQPDAIVSIPAELKQRILDYLRKYHNISTETIYNDLHGFIKTQTIHQSAYTEFYKGLSYQNNQDYDSAIEYYTKAIILKPDLTEAYNNRGNAYSAKGEYDRAIADFDTAIKLNPDDALAYNNRGTVYYRKGEYDKAIADHDKAIELNPDLTETYASRGNAYHGKGDHDRAIADYGKAIKLNPNDHRTYFNRGNTYSDKGDYDRAIADYDRAIALKPDDAEAYNNRGTPYNAKGEYDRAIADYDKAITLNPDLAEAYNNRGTAYNAKGEYDRAIADFDKAIALTPNFAETYASRGNTYSDKGDQDQAIADYGKAIKLNPNDHRIYCNRGSAYNAKGEYDKAITDYDKAIELKPDYAEAYCNRGEACLHLKERWEQAKRDLKTARDKGIDIIDFFNIVYKNVADFESKTGITLPADIAEMLTRKPDEGKT